MERKDVADLKVGQTVRLDGEETVTFMDSVDGGHSVLIRRTNGDTQYVYCGRLS